MRIAESASLTDPGRVRRRNEDAYVCEPPLFAVADGMGGAQAGELASRLATAALREYQNEVAVDPETHLRSSIQEANRRIYARAANDPQVSGMGTTVTAAIVAGDRVAVGHVGDSRGYRIRDGEVEQLTDDHSLVADLVRSGRLTPAEAEVHPQRSVITRALGTDAAVQVDSFSVDARPGDVFLLCSDGLTSMIDEAAVLKALRKSSSLEAAGRTLVQAANKAGGEDNITVILFSIGEGEQEPLPARGVPTVVVGEASPELSGAIAPNGGRPAAPAPQAASARPKPERRVGRAVIIVVLVLALFAALAGVALWGLSRAHFVGVDGDGRVAVYQGVPWNLVGSVHLYREVYVSNLLAVQLTPEERQALLDHDLVSEEEARQRIATYERQAFPS